MATDWLAKSDHFVHLSFTYFELLQMIQGVFLVTRLRFTWPTVLTAAVLVAGLQLAAVSPVRATILAGCVGTFETGNPGTVGYVDNNALLGTGPAHPPALMTVAAPDGTTKSYRNGEGLIAPTVAYPIWFASVDQLGEYTIAADGDVCNATVTSLDAASSSLAPTASPLVTALPQADNGAGLPVGAFALITIGAIGLIVHVLGWRYARKRL
jgi:hypothetical protein